MLEEKKEFHLMARIVKARDYTLQHRRHGKTERVEYEMILFDLTQTTEATKFLGKLYSILENKLENDKNNEEGLEVSASFSHPINKNLRLTCMASSKHLPRPHLMLTSIGDQGEIEDEFKKMEKKKINFKTVFS